MHEGYSEKASHRRMGEPDRLVAMNALGQLMAEMMSDPDDEDLCETGLARYTQGVHLEQ